MGKLGKSGNPIMFRVNNEQRMEEVVTICNKNNWKFICGIEPDQEEDISEVKYMLNPEAFSKPQRMTKPRIEPVIKTEPTIGRNEPCPCGSGLKYKKCCLNK